MKTMTKYCFLQGFFWMLFCSTYGYITFYLLSRSFSASEIGIITAAFGLIGAFAQPFFGRLVDRGLYGWKSLSCVLSLAITLCSLVLVFLEPKLIQGLFFGLTLLFLNSALPLVNRAGFICQTKTQKINYGIARGIGSLSYALLSLILGKFTLLFDSSIVPLTTATISFCLIITLLTMPKGEIPVLEKQTSSSISPFTVLKKYPAFTLMWISCIIQMTFHNLITTFLIQICERAGGTSGTLGLALAISAIVELPVLFCFTKINKHISSKKLLLISAIAFIIKATGYAVSLNISILYITQLTQAISFAIYASASVYYAEEAVHSEDKTTAQSFLSGSQTIGSVAGCLAGGILLTSFGINTMLFTGIAITVLGAIFALLAIKVKNSNSTLIKISLNDEDESKFDSEIQFYSIIISGHDINDETCPRIDFLPTAQFKNGNKIKIENVPAGKDRIITIKAFDQNKTELSGSQRRAVCDIISENENSVKIGQNTTAFGDVLFGVKNIFNFEELEKDGRMNVIKAVIDNVIPPCLFNSSKLIGELQGFSFPYSSTKADYRLSTGKIVFDYTSSQNFSVSVNDPLSAKLTNQKAANSILIEGIAPGNWILAIENENGRILEKYEIQVESGTTNNLGKLAHEDLSAQQNSLDGLTITEENFRKCFADDFPHKRFVVLFSEELYGSSPSSVKAYFNKGINDHNGEYKGRHYNMIRDSKGFWYCSVPYSDVQQTNQCGQPSYNFKVDEKMIPPPEFVPDGYVYQKFNGKYKGEKFLVLIYPTQDEKTVCQKLSSAKNCKSLSDFDLTSEEGKKQIANFRVVPGTKNLYRSFHPYNDDDKKELSNTSKKRMKYVASLSADAKIKADINLSDLKQISATYKMPEYYQEIIDNDAVLYMTDCSYSECYENSSSQKFANGIKKIVQFINEKEGPYQIHCAIGTDRTGVVCAVLSGLCGASWSEIESDYCESVNMGIYEYRGPGAVRYAIINLLGVEFIEDIQDLQKSLTDYFVNGGYLALQEIESMKKRLQS